MWIWLSHGGRTVCIQTPCHSNPLAVLLLFPQLLSQREDYCWLKNLWYRGNGSGLTVPVTTGPIFAVWCRGPKFTNFLHFVRIIDCSAGVCQLDNGMDNGFFCIWSKWWHYVLVSLSFFSLSDLRRVSFMQVRLLATYRMCPLKLIKYACDLWLLQLWWGCMNAGQSKVELAMSRLVGKYIAT